MSITRFFKKPTKTFGLQGQRFSLMTNFYMIDGRHKFDRCQENKINISIDELWAWSYINESAKSIDFGTN